MVIVTGSCRFGLWHIHVTWQGNLVYRVRFAREGVVGPIPRRSGATAPGGRQTSPLLRASQPKGNRPLRRSTARCELSPAGRPPRTARSPGSSGQRPAWLDRRWPGTQPRSWYPATASSRRPALEGSPRIWRSKRPCSPWSGARPDPARREMRGINW